ncbi:alpha/beta fold hydrolase [Thalassotalea sp. PLHSN55]|uniref:alpha/beta fold hydrolase n=1 Tax=Thalassotalea sp. PLHSN55 TaxID=3435888 RepID=UPI003F838EBC
MQLNYQQLGSSDKQIILIHGLFGSLDNLNMIAKPLSEHFTVTSVDVRNHGSSFHKNDMDYALLAQDLIDLLDHLSIESTHLLGHSMGGKIAMKTALLAPSRVDKLIVADMAPVQNQARHQKIIQGLQSLDLAHLKSRKDADNQLSQYVDEVGVRQFLLRNLAAVDGKLAFKCNLDNIVNCYSQILAQVSSEQPFLGETLFIKGGNSDYILAEHKPAIAKIFPNSKAKIIQGAGHWLHAEKPVIFNKICQDFLLK